MDDDARLTRQQISDAVDPPGWSLILGAVYTEVLAPSLVAATEVASVSVSAAGADGQGHLTVDIRADRAVLRLQSAGVGGVTGRDVRLAHAVSEALDGTGTGSRRRQAEPRRRSKSRSTRSTSAWCVRSGRPSWDTPTNPGPNCLHALIDPSGRGPAIWFQQMDAPRPQRNRIHVDVDLPAEGAAARIDAALAAGGRLLSDDAAPAYLGVGRPRGQRGVHLHLAGTGLT